jgi:hypothetical protein
VHLQLVERAQGDLSIVFVFPGGDRRIQISVKREYVLSQVGRQVLEILTRQTLSISLGQRTFASLRGLASLRELIALVAKLNFHAKTQERLPLRVS